MIKIERGKPPEKTAIQKRKEKELRKLRKLAKSGELSSKNFDSRLWSDSKVKDFLYSSQHGKCCYCERKRDIKRESDIDHFRPKAEVKEAEKNHQGYWWLAYCWENLLIACKTCNQEYKTSKFPLRDEKKRAYTENCDLSEEEPFLINPLEEDPECHIDYDICFDVDCDPKKPRLMVQALGKSDRGKKTVSELTGINTREVMQERAKKLKDYKTFVCLIIKNENNEFRSIACDRLREYISRCSEFAGFARFYFKKMGCL